MSVSKCAPKSVTNEYLRPEVVVGRVDEALRQYLAPLALTTGQATLPGLLDDDWQGWPFGRDLYIAEVFSLIQQVPGVKHVLDVQLSQRPVMPGKEAPPLGQLEDFAGNLLNAGANADNLTLVTGKVLFVPADALLCSLNHDVEVVEL